MAKKNNKNPKKNIKKEEDLTIHIPFESENTKSDLETDAELRRLFQEKSRARKNKKQEPTYTASEDEKEFDRDPLFEKAMRLLPIDESPEILTAIQSVSNINFVCFMAASLSENMYRHHMNNEELDCMIAAFILAGSDNINDIIDLFEEKTLLYTKELNEMIVMDDAISFGENRFKYEHFSKPARRMYTAQAVSQLIAVQTNLENEGILIAPHDYIQKLAEILIRESYTNPEQSKEVDARMLEAGIVHYNKIAKKANLTFTVKMLGSGVITKDKKPDNGLPPISFGK